VHIICYINKFIVFLFFIKIKNHSFLVKNRNARSALTKKQCPR